MDKALPMIIDAHVHVTSDGKWFNTNYDASIESLIDELDEAYIDKAILLPIDGFIENDFIIEICARYPDRCIGFASVNPLQEHKAVQRLEHYITRFNLKGLKLHPRLQGFCPLHHDVIRILERCAELSVPAIFDTFPISNSSPIDDMTPMVYDRLAKAVPKAKIILAHSGGHRLLDAMAVAKSNPNIYLEISYSIVYYQGSSVMSDFEFVIRKVGAHRVIYGSDYPEVRIVDSYRQAQKVLKNLSQEQRDLIFGGTISNLLRLESGNKGEP